MTVSGSIGLGNGCWIGRFGSIRSRKKSDIYVYIDKYVIECYRKKIYTVGENKIQNLLSTSFYRL